MFQKILIANRGEIACRIIKTARAMDVRTVAVYSDADIHAMHVSQADEAVHIGGSAPKDSYLLGDRIIEAALATGAQAIHPGYGFLSENPEFVEAVTKAGLVFIGPDAQAIRAMGLKDAAKVLMEESGVPVVPGYHGADQDDETLRSAAKSVGYPVLIKAVAGGGGKGMRLVEKAEDFLDALQSARAEAKSAFGNDDVLIEKYIQKPRHIEMQIFGDGTKAVHLYERDCSLQRRHQKVIEEAPAPGMTEEMRTAMGAAAVRAAEAIGYCGAGTIEFIVDGSDGLRPDRFWFMEMNTRLQVEHPVTEAVTGVDLVAWQLSVASGAPLPLAQDDIPLKGHSFEARLYAEDVPKGFLPATGRIAHLSFPEFARADTGVSSGDEISPFYDPMIAKLTVHGQSRSQALAKLLRALSLTQVAGTVTNLSFLRKLVQDPNFAAGEVDTGLIERAGADLLEDPIPCNRTRAIAAVVAAGLDTSDQGTLTGFSLWQSLSQTVQLEFAGDVQTVGLSVTAQGCQVSIGDQRLLVFCKSGTWWVDGAQTSAEVLRLDHRLWVFFGNAYSFLIPDPLAVDRDEAGQSNIMLAPMPGAVKAVFVKPGESVAQGTRLATLEAMKMEHVLTAARDGVVAEVLVRADQQVESGAVLIRLEDEDQ